MPEPEPASETPIERLLPCVLGGEDYCLDMARIESVERSDRLQENPSDGEPIGWRLGRREMAVYRFTDLLGHPPPTSGGRILVYEDPQERWGFLVDRVARAMDAGERQLFPLSRVAGRRARSLIRGVFFIENRLRLLIDPGRLLQALRTEDLAVAPGRSAVGERPRVSATAPSACRGGRGRMLLFSTPPSQNLDRPVRFGLSFTQVVEVLELPPLIPVPGAPDHLLGLAAWRGQPVPVVDLDRRLGWSGALPGQGQRLLVARAHGSGELVGFAITSDTQPVRLPIKHRPGSFVSDLVRGVFELEAATLVIPDLNNLVAPAAGVHSTNNRSTP